MGQSSTDGVAQISDELARKFAEQNCITPEEKKELWAVAAAIRKRRKALGKDGGISSHSVRVAPIIEKTIPTRGNRRYTNRTGRAT